MTRTDESIDQAIDDVAHAMTDRLAVRGPTLRERVLAQLRPRPPGYPSWLTPPVVVLATALVAVFVIIRSRPVSSRPTTVASSPALQNAVIARVPSPEAPGPDARRPAIVRATTTTNASSAEDWPEGAAPALDAIPALSMTAIQPAALSIAPLEVPPIEQAPPLVVKAIGSDR